MSYDIEVWSVRPIDSSVFAPPERWGQEGSQWVYTGQKWQIVVGHSDKNRILPEDIPQEVAKALPGIQYLTGINLEGVATKEAARLLQSTADRIARSTHGVVLDQQEGSIRTPSGIKRFMPPAKRDSISVLCLSWWFLESPLLTPSGREAFLNLLEQMLPEALPKRYGQYEPPQHLYAETGKSHLFQFWNDHLHETTVWYSHRPVVSFHAGFPNPLGAGKRGFRANTLQIMVDADVLIQPGWPEGLRRFWQKTSLLIKPFYGDVRILNGLFMGRGTIAYGRGSESHPVGSWWWRGIPSHLGKAVVLGDSYQRLWPAFVSAATLVDGLAFLSSPDWGAEGELSEQIKVPDSMAQPRVAGKMIWTKEEAKEYMHIIRTSGPIDRMKKYASLWPFDGPFQEPDTHP